MSTPSPASPRTLLVLVGAVVAVALACVGSAAATTAPSKAIQLAVSSARTQFHTGHVHATFSLLSRRDRSWALVDGTATARHRLWAAWLRRGGNGTWQLRYFDTTAPFQPQSTRHGRVPCDLYPAFSEPLCPPSGPSAGEIKVQLFRQLAPSGRAARIGALLRNGGYSFTFRSPVNGTLVIAWYLVPKGARITASAPKPTLIARGKADFFGHTGRVTIKLTTAGKQTLKHATTLKLTAKGTFTRIVYAAVSTTRIFTLTR